MKTIKISDEFADKYSQFCIHSNAYAAGFAAGMRQQANFDQIQLAQLLSAQGKTEAPASQQTQE